MRGEMAQCQPAAKRQRQVTPLALRSLELRIGEAIGECRDHVAGTDGRDRSCDRSIEHLRLYYIGDGAVDDALAASRDATLQSWREVFNEDIDAVEGMQRGRQSPGFAGGVFSPVMDNPTHHFHQWVARKLQAG